MNLPTATPDIIGDFNDIKDLRNKIYVWLYTTFSDKTIVNQDTKFEIGFNSKSFDKLVSGKPGTTKLLCLTALEEIIRQGILTKVEKDKKERKDILAYYYFESPVIFEDDIYKYWFTVRQLLNGKFLYSGNLDIKKPLQTNSSRLNGVTE